MTEYTGTLVRTKRVGWDPRYRNKVFLVTKVFVNDEGRWTFQLYDHIQGGFIWASLSEVRRVRPSVKKSTEGRRPREDRAYAKVLGILGPERGDRDRGGAGRTRGKVGGHGGK